MSVSRSIKPRARAVSSTAPASSKSRPRVAKRAKSEPPESGKRAKHRATAPLKSVPPAGKTAISPLKSVPPSGKAAILAAERGMYERYIPLVRRIGMRVVRRLPPDVSADDILGAGWIGLIEALQRRTATMTDGDFEAYASHRIRGSILDYLRILDPMSRKLRGASRRIAEAIRTLSARLGRAPEEEEIALELGVDIARYRNLLSDVATAQFARLELTDLLTPRSQPDAGPDFLAQRRELTDSVALAIEQLPERLRTVLGLYYQDECNFREIGDIVGVTESRVCQLHSEAIHRVRASVDAFEDRPTRSTPVTPHSKFRR